MKQKTREQLKSIWTFLLAIFGLVVVVSVGLLIMSPVGKEGYENVTVSIAPMPWQGIVITMVVALLLVLYVTKEDKK